MAVPKRRTSHARQGKRRSHLNVTAPQVQFCTNCGEVIKPHTLCSACGHYRNREVVVMAQAEGEGK